MKKRLFALAAAVMMIITSCWGCKAEDENIPATTEHAPSVTTEPSTEPVPEDTEAPTEAPTETLPPVYSTEGQNDPDHITIALYQYLPDSDLYEWIAHEMWQEIAPGVELEFVEWDCYLGDDPAGVDVIMYDALFTTYLAERGWLRPITLADVERSDDILPVAMDGAYHNGQLYGIPTFLCGNFLIHYKDDTEVAQADTVYELYDILADDVSRHDASEGLLIDLENGYTTMYLDAYVDTTGEYSYFDSPDILETLWDENSSIKESIECLEEMGGKALVYEYSGSFEHARWFGEGYGRALFGFSECMTFLDDIIHQIDIKTMSLSENGNTQLLYADVLSVNSTITNPEKIDLCMKLINMLAGEEFLYRLSMGEGNVQYLLPARESVYLTAAQTHPLYQRLLELVTHDSARIFRFGMDVYEYTDNAWEYLYYDDYKYRH